MIIKNIRINQFGKVKDKDISLEPNINVIYGKNEAGKSTVLKFIASMFFGANKTKNGKDISDFDMYEPWQEGDFSGKISYKLDNGEAYEVYRDFRKKNPVIYNEHAEDISKDFSIDKTKGSEFFKDQTGIDEELFYSTVVGEQDRIKLDEKEQSALLQKMTNLVSSGSDSISYKKAIDKLKNKLLEEVGTERTIEKPKNKVDNKLTMLTSEYEKMRLISDRQYGYDESEKNMQNKINNNENYVNAIKEIIREKENENVDSKVINNSENEIKELEQTIENKREEQNNKVGKNSKKKISIAPIIISIILLIATVLLFVFNKIPVINYIVLGLTILCFIYTIYKLISANKTNKRINDEQIKQNKEIEILENNIASKKLEVEKAKEDLNKQMAESFETIRNKYMGINLEESFKKDLDAVRFELERNQDKINELKIKLREIQTERLNSSSQIEKMPEIEEEIEKLKEEKEDLMLLANEIQLARDTLEESYDEMKKNLTPKFTENLSKLAEKISGGKYKNVKFSDDQGLIAEMENGEYKKVERLSTGTILQMYLSLRLSIAEEITEEKLPIILDEAFVYYDDERLENILTYLSNEYKDRQIILFTCSNREKEILDSHKTNYNYVEI